MKNYIVALLFLIISVSNSHAYRQYRINAPETLLVASTFEVLQVIQGDSCEIRLGREISAAYFEPFHDGIRYKYTLSSIFDAGDVIDEFCLYLPEIGIWRIRSVNLIDNNKQNIMRNLTIKLECFAYDSNDVIVVDYNVNSHDDIVIYDNCSHPLYAVSSNHYGMRPSTENLGHIRAAHNTLFSKSSHDRVLEFYIVKDGNAIPGNKFREIDSYDDLYFSIKPKSGAPYFPDLDCYIIPRIFFVKFEAPSLVVNLDADQEYMKFSIIVQQFESSDQTSWSYHRLEIVRERAAHAITITDLGPVPRSEWEPGWPDPATTPLWKAVEDPYAHDEE